MPPAPGLLPAPSVEAWRRAVEAGGELALESFDDLELLAVGADSPLGGLVPPTRPSSLDLPGFDQPAFDPAALDPLHPGPLADQAREGLRARGLLAGEPARGLSGTAPPLPSDAGSWEPAGLAARTGAASGQPGLALGGDLAGIVALRRQPALVAVVSVLPADRARAPSLPAGPEAVLAVLHGFAVTGAGLVAVLEEIRSPDGIHRFTLCTPAREAERLFGAWADLGSESQAALAVHVYIPEPGDPRHVQLALQGGVGTEDSQAVSSSGGRAWEVMRSAGVEGAGWTDLFVEALHLLGPHTPE